jgi:hypothetical protein
MWSGCIRAPSDVRIESETEEVIMFSYPVYFNGWRGLIVGCISGCGRKVVIELHLGFNSLF